MAVEIHQRSANSSDLSFALELRGVEHDPRLTIAPVAGETWLTWPFPSASYGLQSTTNLSAGVWLPVAASVMFTQRPEPRDPTDDEHQHLLPPTEAMKARGREKAGGVRSEFQISSLSRGRVATIQLLAGLVESFRLRPHESVLLRLALPQSDLALKIRLRSSPVKIPTPLLVASLALV